MNKRSVFRPRRRTRRVDANEENIEIPDLEKAFREFHDEDRSRLARLLAPIPDALSGTVARVMLLVVQTIVIAWFFRFGPIEIALVGMGIAAALWSM